MSGVALDVPVGSPRPRSFLRLLWAVVAGAFLASMASLGLGLALHAIGWLPLRSLYPPSPFPVDGVWSVAADVVVVATYVLVSAWLIRMQVVFAVGNDVSFGVIVLTVAVVAYVPALVVTDVPPLVALIVTLLLMTWVIRRFAIGRSLPSRGPSRHGWLALGVLAVGVFASYVVYHPLMQADSGGGAFDNHLREVTVRNSGWANVTILRVTGGGIGKPDEWPSPYKLPHTVHSHGEIGFWVKGLACKPRVVAVTLSVLGRTTTQHVSVQPDWVTTGFHVGDAPAC